MTTNSPRKACVFCNGDLKDPVRVKRIASNCDLLIAADGGARFMVDLGLKPGIVIGDLNSVAPDMLKNGGNISRIPCSPDKVKKVFSMAQAH